VGEAEARDDTEAHLAALAAEVAELRAEVARLRAKNAELLRTAALRDFERPPHYQ